MRNTMKILYEYLHTLEFPACDACATMFAMRIFLYVPLGHCENKLV